MSGVWLLRPLPGRTFGDAAAMSPEQRARHDRLRDARRRRAFAVSRTAVSAVVAAVRGVPFGEAVWDGPAGGRPTAAGLSLSVSHAGDVTVVAVAEAGRAVGVDVEPLRPPAETVEVLFGVEQRAAFDAAPRGDRWRAVLDAWLAAEAAFKAGVERPAAFADSADGAYRVALVRDGGGPPADVSDVAAGVGLSAERLAFPDAGPQTPAGPV